MSRGRAEHHEHARISFGAEQRRDGIAITVLFTPAGGRPGRFEADRISRQDFKSIIEDLCRGAGFPPPWQ